MLKLYYAVLPLMHVRVVSLAGKAASFELLPVDLSGEQFSPISCFY